MPSQTEIVRYCPICKKEKRPTLAWSSEFFEYSWVRLTLPYFLCDDCHTIGIDKKLVQNAVSMWRKQNASAHKKISHGDAYKKAKVFLSETLQRYIENHYFEIARFDKKP